MQLSPYVDAVHRDLTAAAEAGGPDVVAAADRLGYALDPALRLALLDALGTAAAEIGSALPEGGGVELRLRGRDPEFVVLVPPAVADIGPGDVGPGHLDAGGDSATFGGGPPDAEESTARLTVRLPDSVKTRIEEAAAREGLSVNSWLVRAALVSLSGPPAPPPPPAPPFVRGAGRRLSGWVG